MALRSDKERSGQALGLDSMNDKRFLKIFLYPFFACPKKVYPPKRAPRRFASACVGFPRRAHESGVAMNSHIRALRQHNDPAPLSCTRLGCQTMGMKVKSQIPTNPKGRRVGANPPKKKACHPELSEGSPILA